MPVFVAVKALSNLAFPGIWFAFMELVVPYEASFDERISLLRFGYADIERASCPARPEEPFLPGNAYDIDFAL
jgi:hypothetical protein